MTTVGQRVAELRQLAGLNRPRLAREADVSYSFLVQVETGQRENPQADKLAKVAKVLGVPVEYLLATDEPLPTPADAGLAQLRLDLVARINAMGEDELRATAAAIEQSGRNKPEPQAESAKARKSAPSAVSS